MADLYVFLGLCVLVVSAEIRGIDPSQTGRYDKQRFVCFDDSREILHEAVNDDYCDCLDGSDEPGTSACVEGMFYCRNKGYRPQTIASFFVDDGVCDCCDGSDEKYIQCPQTCFKLGEKMRTEVKQKIAIYEQSLEEKRHRASEAEGIKQKWREELKQCEEDIAKQQERCNALKARLDVLEAEEQDKEEELKGNETSNNATVEEKPNVDADADPDTKEDGSTDHSTKDEDAENEATVETPQDDDEHETHYQGEDEEDREGIGYTNENDADETSEDADDDNEEEEGNNEKTAVEEEKDLDNPEAPSKGKPSLSVLARLKRWGSSLWPSGKKSKKESRAEKDVPIEDLELQQVRKEHTKEKKELRNLEQRRDDLRTKLNRDYGSDDRFVSLVDQCFECKQDKYTYEICPFDHADQKEGHRRVTLGRFDGFADDYVTMHFKRGQRCPGKHRSLTVKLECGKKESILLVDEPAMCEYTADFSTPVACTDSELNKLKKEARLMGIEGIEDKETRTDEDAFKDEL